MVPSPLLLGILLVPVLPGLPFTGDGATHTGDLDLYASPQVSTLCPAVIYRAGVTLELLAPLPGDRVAIMVYGEQPAGAPAAIATFAQPKASVDITIHGCREVVIAVIGLAVAGDEERAYRIAYGPAGGSLGTSLFNASSA